MFAAKRFASDPVGSESAGWRGHAHRRCPPPSWWVATACVSLSMVLSGCTALLSPPERPNVSISHLELVDFQLFEQRYRLYLRVQNPNDFALSVTGMSFALELNGRRFASGVSARPLEVPPFGEAVTQVDVVSSLARALEQLQRAREGGLERVSYTFSGVLRLGNGGMRLPFARNGELVLLPPADHHEI